MKLLHVAAGVLNQTPLDWHGNYQRIAAAIAEAKSRRIALLCLPELCVTGYGCEDAFQSPNVLARSEQMLLQLLPLTTGIAVSVGLPFACAGGLFNGVALLADGKIAGVAAKQHLAGDGLHYEPRWFKAWPAHQMVALPLAGRTVQAGDIVFNFHGVRIGFEVCEDAWVGSRPGANLAQRGVDIILNPSASHFAFGKHDVRRRFVLEGSRAFQVSYVYSNLLGNEAGRAIYDGDAMIAAGGKLLALGQRFSFHDVGLTAAIIDLQWTRMLRARTASFRPQIADDRIGDEVNVDFELLPASLKMLQAADHQVPGSALTRLHNLELSDQRSPLQANPGGAVSQSISSLNQSSTSLNHSGGVDLSSQQSRFSKDEEFTLAVSLALFDYLRKSRSAGVVISLSGGADSAAVTLLSWFMLRLALAELGSDGLQEKLSYLKSVQTWHKSLRSEMTLDQQVQLLAPSLIHTVYQATKNSGQVTTAAAKTIADFVHSSHHVWDVERLVHLYRDTVESTLGRTLEWETDDVTLQNIQARTRSPSVWMLANIHNALLLSTSNRSEAAVGYATMDGDTSGGLSPIAGIDKNYLRHWLRWLEHTGFPGVGPLPLIACINQQQPTAELRPASEQQTDEGDLMPYDLLDSIERLAIRDKIEPAQVLVHLRLTFPQYSDEQLRAWVRKFFQLWSRNQWKRERYAPSFHVDDENLDPKTWCRWPILNGGFVAELEAMDRDHE